MQRTETELKAIEQFDALDARLFYHFDGLDDAAIAVIQDGSIHFHSVVYDGRAVFFGEPAEDVAESWSEFEYARTAALRAYSKLAKRVGESQAFAAIRAALSDLAESTANAA